MNTLVDRLKGLDRVKCYIALALCAFVVLAGFHIFGAEEKSFEPKSELLQGEMAEPRVGSLGSATEKDDMIVEVVDKIKPQVEEKLSLKFDSIEPVIYHSQIVAGKNYFVKVRAKVTGGATKIMHLRIFKNLKGELSLTAIEPDKDESDPVKYF